MDYRYAERQDAALILEFIKALAEYENLSDEVVATPETLEEWIFDRQKAEVIFALHDGVEVGFALFFHNFSTFLGRAGLYLEDLFVKPAYRGRGYGKGLLSQLAKIALRPHKIESVQYGERAENKTDPAEELEHDHHDDDQREQQIQADAITKLELPKFSFLFVHSRCPPAFYCSASAVSVSPATR